MTKRLLAAPRGNRARGLSGAALHRALAAKDRLESATDEWNRHPQVAQKRRQNIENYGCTSEQGTGALLLIIRACNQIKKSSHERESHVILAQ
jgi:hypothetical protein